MRAGIGGNVAAYSECRECGFVLRAESTSDPQPKYWDECPRCGDDDFAVADDELFGA